MKPWPIKINCKIKEKLTNLYKKKKMKILDIG